VFERAWINCSLQAVDFFLVAHSLQRIINFLCHRSSRYQRMKTQPATNTPTAWGSASRCLGY
jgi:hypothetical protein